MSLPEEYVRLRDAYAAALCSAVDLQRDLSTPASDEERTEDEILAALAEEEERIDATLQALNTYVARLEERAATGRGQSSEIA